MNTLKGLHKVLNNLRKPMETVKMLAHHVHCWPYTMIDVASDNIIYIFRLCCHNFGSAASFGKKDHDSSVAAVHGTDFSGL